MARILIVEDDESLREMYRSLLLEEGYEVDTAVGGIDGLEQALKSHPDVILLDIDMPDVDGMTVMRELRQDPWGKKACIIILTNLDANDERLGEIIANDPAYYLLKVQTLPTQVLEKIKAVTEGSKKGETAEESQEVS